MTDILIFCAGIALLCLAYTLHERKKERDLLTRLKAASSSRKAVVDELERATEEERKRQEFWYRQNPSGKL